MDETLSGLFSLLKKKKPKNKVTNKEFKNSINNKTNTAGSM